MTDRWLPAELAQFLTEDPELRLLFVEGKSDILLWRYFSPEECRGNSQIYSMCSVEVAVAEGGEKARALEFARHCHAWPQDSQQRIAFFVDSDCDRFLDVTYPALVSVTDGRDMESYVLHGGVLRCLCEIGAGERPAEAAIVAGLITRLLRPLGLLRIASAQNEWYLPFQATLIDGSLRRFFRERRYDITLQVDALHDALLDQADLPRTMKTDLVNKVAELEATLRNVSDWQIVQGKDLVAFFSWYFETPLKIATGLLALSLAAESEQLKQMANLGELDRWLRAA